MPDPPIESAHPLTDTALPLLDLAHPPKHVSAIEPFEGAGSDGERRVELDAPLDVGDRRGRLSQPVEVQIVDAALRVNDHQKDSVIKRIRRVLPELAGKTVALLGLAFKPETDDMRDAPSLRIVSDLQAAGASIRAYDPSAMESAARLLTGVEYCEDEYEAARGGDALVVVTEWNQFRSLDFARLKRLMREPAIVDLRNIYEPEAARAAGFRYTSIGRG